MKTVKVGTRLTLVLLLALTPVVAIYTYWSVARSTRTYIDDLKRETRASTRALVPAVENDLRVDERDQIYDVLRRMSRDGTLSALLNSEGKLWLAQPGFPHELAPGSAEFGLLDARGFAEFERSVGGRRWFCRLVPVSVAGHRTGYLLVSQDWTDISAPRSTARRCPRPSSKANCSATSAAHSPTRARANPGLFTAARRRHAVPGRNRRNADGPAS